MGVPPDFVGQLEGSPKVSMLRQVGAHVWYLGINNQKKPFDDKRVRQALNYAVNKDAIVKDVLKGTGAVSKGPVLPNTWGADAGAQGLSLRSAAREEAPRRGGLPERLLDDLVGAGVRLGHAVARRHVHGDAVEPQGRRRQRDAPDDGVGRVSSPSCARKEQELFALSWMAGTEDPDMVMYPLLHSSQWTPNGPNRALYKNDALRRAAAPRRGS